MSNFTVVLLFVTLKKCQNIGSLRQAVDSFPNGFSGLSRNGPQLPDDLIAQRAKEVMSDSLGRVDFMILRSG